MLSIFKLMLTILQNSSELEQHLLQLCCVLHYGNQLLSRRALRVLTAAPVWKSTQCSPGWLYRLQFALTQCTALQLNALSACFSSVFC